MGNRPSKNKARNPNASAAAASSSSRPSMASSRKSLSSPSTEQKQKLTTITAVPVPDIPPVPVVSAQLESGESGSKQGDMSAATTAEPVPATKEAVLVDASATVAEEPDSEPAAPYKVICLTGGPCGGKTSSLAILGDLFQSLGWKVYRVPETATILLSGGVVFGELNDAQSYSFQKNLLKTMLTIQNTFIDLAKLNAKRGQKTVVICDRGAMDPAAYMPRPGWLQILKELDLDEVALRDHRYDCVIHLVTAAKGAEPFYTLDNNTTRSEGLEFAREVDDKVMNAWLGHASLQVIDNASVSNFAQKCDRTVQAVLTRLGLVTDSERYGRHVRKHKFVVHGFELDKPFPVSYRDFNVEHVYLVNTSGDGKQIRIRRREEVGGSREVHLSLTARHPKVDSQRVETRRNLTGREYDALRAQADPSRAIITKRRRCFLLNDRYFQLDVYLHPSSGLTLLETYLDFDFVWDQDESKKSTTSNDVTGRLPPWLKLEEVTDNKAYSMYTIAESAPHDPALARKLSTYDLSAIASS
ncbi:AAA domain protein [Phlyctochytrium arcticum]|nr:AAA domain protein [Phlyctochytrium arcticum]